MLNAQDLSDLVTRVHLDVQPHIGQGRVADYIPALARVDPQQFGLAIATCAGAAASVGDGRVPFSIQSISKVFFPTLALDRLGDSLCSAWAVSPRALHSTPSCSSSASRASRATPCQRRRAGGD